MGKYAASMEDVIAASKRIKGHGHRTPILTNKTINELTGKKLSLIHISEPTRPY